MICPFAALPLPGVLLNWHIERLTMRVASRSSFGARGDQYHCVYPWPQDWYLQCGDRGIVLSRSASEPAVRTTAFFEVLAEGIFFRGEGTTVAEAEEDAWCRYIRVESCRAHEYERRFPQWLRHVQTLWRRLESVRAIGSLHHLW